MRTPAALPGRRRAQRVGAERLEPRRVDAACRRRSGPSAGGARRSRRSTRPVSSSRPWNVDPAGRISRASQGAPTCPRRGSCSNAAKAEIREVDPRAVAAASSAATAFLDVREPDEYDQGAVPGAVHVPRGQLEFNVEGRLPDKARPVAVYCAGGVRSAFAAKTLQDLGYRDVVSMAGGFNRWKDEGLTVVDAAHAHRATSATATTATCCCPRSARQGQQRAARRQGPPARRGGPGLAGGALPRRGRRRARSASSTWTSWTPPTSSARSCTTSTASACARSTARAEDADRDQPRRQRARPTTRAWAPTTSCRSSTGYDLIVDGTDNFPTRYLVNDAVAAHAHPGRARLDLPLRGPGHRLQPLRRALLPVHDPRAAAGRARAELRGGRGARRAARASSARSRPSRRSSCCSTSATR